MQSRINKSQLPQKRACSPPLHHPAVGLHHPTMGLAQSASTLIGHWRRGIEILIGTYASLFYPSASIHVLFCAFDIQH